MVAPHNCTLAILLVSSIAVAAVSSVALEEGFRNAKSTVPEHMQERQEMLKSQELQTIGGTLKLDKEEKLANELIMKAKRIEVDEGFKDVSKFNPAQHFFRRRHHIEETTVFKMIKDMPKGAILHAHNTALIGGEYLLNVTYMDNVYACLSEDIMKLQFFKTPPVDNDCTWILLSKLRKNHVDAESLDKRLLEKFSMDVLDPEVKYPNVDMAWKRFNDIFAFIGPMLSYKPVWEAHFYEVLRQLRQDGVFYLEVRSTLPVLYDLNGNVYDAVECARVFKTATDRFMKDYPHFLGARFIYAPMKVQSKEQIREYIKLAVRLKKEFGDFFAGFDLVGQEDKGRPLLDFIEDLVQIPKDIQVFYHAGETNWFGTPSDYNVIDVVLLRPKRIGHGYAILKHPAVAKAVKDNGIAIEVNPLSNQILKLVDDLRNHPAAVMIANNFPVVISSDDPGFWSSLPMTHDYYTAFVGIASRDSDIRLLKQLLLNTIEYSCMPKKQKEFAVAKFNAQWKCWIKDVIKKFGTL